PWAVAYVDDGEAAAVDGDGVAHLQVLGDEARVEGEPSPVAGANRAELGDYAGEHSSTFRSSPRRSTAAMLPRQTSSIVWAPGPANNDLASSPPKSTGAR